MTSRFTGVRLHPALNSGVERRWWSTMCHDIVQGKKSSLSSNLLFLHKHEIETLKMLKEHGSLVEQMLCIPGSVASMSNEGLKNF